MPIRYDDSGERATSNKTAVITTTTLYRMDPRQLRVPTDFTVPQDGAFADLKASIAENGVVDPLTVYKHADGTMEVLDHPATLAAVLALIAEGTEIVSVPVVITTLASPVDLLLYPVVANTQRRLLSAIEEAETFRKLVAYGWSQLAVARRIGKSPSYVSARLLLLEARPGIYQALLQNEVTPYEAIQVVREAESTGTSQEEVLAHKHIDKVSDVAKTPPRGARVYAGKKRQAAKSGWRQTAPVVAPQPDVPFGTNNIMEHLRALMTYFAEHGMPVPPTPAGTIP